MSGMLDQFERNRNMKSKPVDMVCQNCEGAGTIENCRSELKVSLCSNCNGHGHVMFDGVQANKFELTQHNKEQLKRLLL